MWYEYPALLFPPPLRFPPMDAAPASFDSAPVVFAPPESARFLIELEARQDEVLRQLDELNHRIEQAIVLGQVGIRRAEDVMQPNGNKSQAA